MKSSDLKYVFLPHVDVDECQKEDICGQNAKCNNTPGSYYCICNAGFRLKSGKSNFTGNEEKCEGKGYDDVTKCE